MICYSTDRALKKRCPGMNLRVCGVHSAKMYVLQTGVFIAESASQR